ncbi:unnamed protein product [Cyprideis torosa]|uniref:Uncharacterized protein n=1 Tax=Cyprideis torosa TaxID=163714 RepID=A0A7R8ZM47_9CRUS|nr:unnamed protein product [Cyprideis torosa]CAG0893370.1 unnamed protein product [Cyprideis torosa]
MYFLLGWPHTLRTIKVPRSRIVSVRCNRDRVLLAVLYENAIELWHYKPCVPIVCHQIPGNLATLYGVFRFVEWRPDSSSVVIVTEHGYLLFFDLRVKEGHHAYSQVDSSRPGLRRESAELYSKEEIPAIQLHLRSSVLISGSVSCGTSMRDELMVATQTAQIQRLSWEGEINRDYCVDLRRVPFCTDKQVAIGEPSSPRVLLVELRSIQGRALKMAGHAIPLTDTGVFVTAIDYSPLLPGFSIVLNDGRAAFLAASSFKFDPNSVQGIWATQLSDATCTALNHKYRLIAFGKRNSDCVVYCIDDLTGGLTVSHVLHLSERAYSGPPSPVTELHWTPDGSAVAVTWANGGLGLWSVFGSLLMCSLSWDERGLFVSSMDWGPEGYTLWMVTVEAQPLENGASPVCSCSAPPAFPNHNAIGLLAPAMPQPPLPSPSSPPPLRHSGCDKKPVAWTFSLKQYHLVKSALTVNPAMCYQERLFLQGEDRLYINANEPRCVTTPAPGTGASRRPRHFSTGDDLTPPSSRNPSAASETDNGSAHLANQIGNKQWFTITIPSTYSSTNWPIRYTALDSEAVFVAVAGRYGFAHYSLTNRKWKLFGSEAQERDFIVTGGMVWWRGFVVLGCYNLAKLQVGGGDDQASRGGMRLTFAPLAPPLQDEVRLYPQAAKLDNVHALITRLESQVLLLSLLGDVLGIYEADNTLLLFQLGLAKDRVGASVSIGDSSTSEVSVEKPLKSPLSQSLCPEMFYSCWWLSLSFHEVWMLLLYGLLVGPQIAWAKPYRRHSHGSNQVFEESSAEQRRGPHSLEQLLLPSDEVIRNWENILVPPSVAEIVMDDWRLDNANNCRSLDIPIVLDASQKLNHLFNQSELYPSEYGICPYSLHWETRVVPSSPGKDFPAPQKIQILSLRCHCAESKCSVSRRDFRCYPVYDSIEWKGNEVLYFTVGCVCAQRQSAAARVIQFGSQRLLH